MKILIFVILFFININPIGVEKNNIQIDDFLQSSISDENYKLFREEYLWEWKKNIFDWNKVNEVTLDDELLKTVPSENYILDLFYGDNSLKLSNFLDKYIIVKKTIGHTNGGSGNKDIISEKFIKLRDYNKYRAKILYEWALTPIYGDLNDGIQMKIPTEYEIKESFINSYFPTIYNPPLR